MSNCRGSKVGLCEIRPLDIGGREDLVVCMDGRWLGGEVEHFNTFEVMGTSGRYVAITTESETT